MEDNYLQTQHYLKKIAIQLMCSDKYISVSYTWIRRGFLVKTKARARKRAITRAITRARATHEQEQSQQQEQESRDRKFRRVGTADRTVEERQTVREGECGGCADEHVCQRGHQKSDRRFRRIGTADQAVGDYCVKYHSIYSIFLTKNCFLKGT